jgi:hypothetical protein
VNCFNDNPVRRAFVAKNASPTASTGRFSTLVPSKDDRAGAGDHHNSWSATKCAFEGDFHVADYFNGAADNFDQQPLQDTGDPVVAGSGDTGAGSRNLTWRNAALDTSFVDRARQGISGACLTHAQNAASRSRPRCQDRILIAEETARLGSATVNAKEEGHVEILN